MVYYTGNSSSNIKLSENNSSIYAVLSANSTINYSIVYCDVSKITIDATFNEIMDLIPNKSYSYAGGSQIFLNDEVSKNLYIIKFDDTYPCKVEQIVDTGIKSEYIASSELLSSLKSGISLDEIVQIIGRPLGIPTYESTTVLWRIDSFEKKVSLSFDSSYLMIFTGE